MNKSQQEFEDWIKSKGLESLEKNKFGDYVSLSAWAKWQAWQARESTLENKPSFADHPDAFCFVQNDDGSWIKNTKTADVESGDFGGWNVPDHILGSWSWIQQGICISGWRESLTINPEKVKV